MKYSLLPSLNLLRSKEAKYEVDDDSSIVEVVTLSHEQLSSKRAKISNKELKEEK
jgi:hypothetical protein